MTQTSFESFVPTKILFGCGQLKNLHTCNLPGRKALIVTTAGKSIRANGYLDALFWELETAGVEYALFDKAEPNPITQNAEYGALVANTCKCDFIIGLGGGSAIDAAKAIALSAVNRGNIWDYIGGRNGEKRKIKIDPLPLIAIPTTAGTGSEIDPAFVITNTKTTEKMGMYLPELFPRIAVIDPVLMVSVPARLTAFQGFDALFHSTEGYISRKAHIMSDMVAEKAIEVIGKNLAAAVRTGDDIKAREQVAFGSMLSGIQLTIGSLTSAHALEHAMSAYHQDLPHGAGLVMISVAYYKQFVNVPELRGRFIRMAQLMGNPEASAPEDFIHVLEGLIRDCGLSDLKMSEYCILKDEFAAFADNAVRTGQAKFEHDFRRLEKPDCIRIFRESYK